MIVPLYRIEPAVIASCSSCYGTSGTSPWCVDDDDIKWMNVGEIITYLIAIKLRICSCREWRGVGGGNNNCTHHNHVEGGRSSSHPVDVGCCEIIVLTRKQQQRLSRKHNLSLTFCCLQTHFWCHATLDALPSFTASCAILHFHTIYWQRRTAPVLEYLWAGCCSVVVPLML